MSHYKMKLTGSLNKSDYENIYGYLGVVDFNDSFHIDIAKDSNINLDIISKMLIENRFQITREKKNEDGSFIIFANKKRE